MLTRSSNVALALAANTPPVPVYVAVTFCPTTATVQPALELVETYVTCAGSASVTCTVDADVAPPFVTVNRNRLIWPGTTPLAPGVTASSRYAAVAGAGFGLISVRSRQPGSG